MAQRGVNRVILVGNLGRDPEGKFTQQGTAVCNLAVATSEAWKDKNTGQQQERTEWHRVSAFGKLAEIMTQYLAKGSKVYIEGKLRTRSWEQDSVTRYATEIIADELQMLDSKPQGQQPAPSPQQQPSGQQSAPQGASGGYPDFDDDSGIPFSPFMRHMEHCI